MSYWYKYYFGVLCNIVSSCTPIHSYREAGQAGRRALFKRWTNGLMACFDDPYFYPSADCCEVMGILGNRSCRGCEVKQAPYAIKNRYRRYSHYCRNSLSLALGGQSIAGLNGRRIPQ